MMTGEYNSTKNKIPHETTGDFYPHNHYTSNHNPPKLIPIEIVQEEIKVQKLESSIPKKARKSGINLSKFPGSFANRRR